MKNKKLNGGFTLIEIIISVAIFFMIGLFVVFLSSGISKFSTSFNENLDTQGELIRAIETMSLEARSMGQSSVGGYPIDSAASSSFVFYSDIDGDGLFERIRYYTNGSVLKKAFLKPTGNPLVYNDANEKISDVVSNIVTTSSTPIFSYYDSNFSGTESPLNYPINILDIRVVKILLSAAQNPQSQPISFSVYVMPRNLKIN